jgi:hypothetical protein
LKLAIETLLFSAGRLPVILSSRSPAAAARLAQHALRRAANLIALDCHCWTLSRSGSSLAAGEEVSSCRKLRFSATSRLLQLQLLCLQMYQQPQENPNYHRSLNAWIILPRQAQRMILAVMSLSFMMIRYRRPVWARTALATSLGLCPYQDFLRSQ